MFHALPSACEQMRSRVWHSGAQGRGGEVLVRSSLTSLKCIWRSLKKIESSETSFVQCFWQLEQRASAVIKEVEQRKCKSTCETGEIGKPVVEDGG